MIEAWLLWYVFAWCIGCDCAALVAISESQMARRWVRDWSGQERDSQ